ncbi:MAG: hypothetical protein HQL66_09515, partial [Magnetococcales bacterium]|nr:hypothetical protein [Magnetococcales bacterium]
MRYPREISRRGVSCRKTFWSGRLRAGLWLLFCLGLSLLQVGQRAVADTTTGNASVAAIWLADQAGLFALDPASGAVTQEIDQTPGARTLVVDGTRGVVWAYGKLVLSAHRVDGTLLFSRQIPFTFPAEEREEREEDADFERPGWAFPDHRRPQLALDPRDGTVWLARGRLLQRVDATGQVLATVRLDKEILAIAEDPTRSRLWVTVRDARLARAFSATGQEVAILDPEGRGSVTDLAYDPVADRLWLSLNRQEIASYTPDGKPDFRRRGLHFQPGWLTPDGHGGAWFADNGQTLTHLDANGTAQARVHPFKKGQGPWRDLEVDPGDGTLWVAAADGLAQIATDGSVRRQWDVGNTVKKDKNDKKNKGDNDLLALRPLRAMALQRLTAKPPELTFTTPAEGSLLNTNRPPLGVSVSGEADPKSLLFKVKDAPLAVQCQWNTTSTATCTPTAPLSEGPVSISATITSPAGKVSQAGVRSFTIDSLPPVITLTNPASGLITNQAALVIAGGVNEPATLTLNGNTVTTDANHAFSYPVTLNTGGNTFTLAARDLAGNTSTITLSVTLDQTPPAAPVMSLISVSKGSIANQVSVNGGSGSVEGGAKVTLTNVGANTTTSVQAAADGSFSATLAARPGDLIRLGATDAAGNVGATVTTVVAGLPPDPTLVAPPTDTTLPATRLDQTTAFLYAGATPIQTGVAAQAIQPQRAAVVRGGVSDASGAPVSAVKVTLPNHPELGQTLSRNDGRVDLAVNGGESLTVRFEKQGYLPVDRQIKPDWQGWAHVPPVVMTPLDAKVTPVDLTATTPVQVVRGSQVADGDGTRQATLLFPQGTSATMQLPDGSSQPLTTLNVRATEYTVGATGKQAMPATLPATSGYTYAVELSVDEAQAAGAKNVSFTQPVPVYVDNFLHFPIGGAVPVGYYDRD